MRAPKVHLVYYLDLGKSYFFDRFLGQFLQRLHYMTAKLNIKVNLKVDTDGSNGSLDITNWIHLTN